MRTGLNRNVTAAGAKIRYDAQCKKVLADRQVLAWILKYATEEFADMPLSQICLCIEEYPQVGNVRVAETVQVEVQKGEQKVEAPKLCRSEREPELALTGTKAAGHMPGNVSACAETISTECVDAYAQRGYNSNRSISDSITGMTNEDRVPGEGVVYYDLRFKAYLPSKKEIVTILVNLEAQKNFYAGYSLVTRGVFYGARMLSSQLDTEFSIPRYDDLKKVYSIWLCMDAPEYIGNAVTRYRMEKEAILGSMPVKRQEYDKLSVVMVCLNAKGERKTAFTEVMNTLLSEELTAEEKKEILANRYHFVMERPLEEEVNTMCNLSELVWERGISEGMERGRQDKTRIVVANMLKRGMAEADIMALAECSKEFIKEVMEKVSVSGQQKW